VFVCALAEAFPSGLPLTSSFPRVLQNHSTVFALTLFLSTRQLDHIVCNLRLTVTTSDGMSDLSVA